MFLAQESEMLERLVESVIFDVCGHIICDLLDVIGGITHRDSDRAVL